MDEGLMSSISLGFDIATAVSIIGGVIAFIYNMRKMNKIDKGEEREKERVIQLSKGRDELGKLIEKYHTVAIDRKIPEINEAIVEIQKYVNCVLWQKFLVFALEEDIEKLKGTREYWDKEAGQYDVREFFAEIIKIEMTLLLSIRVLMNNESKEMSKKIIVNYCKEKYEVSVSFTK